MGKGLYLELKPNNVDEIVWLTVIDAWSNGMSDREAAFRASKQSERMIKADDIRAWKKENPEIGELCEFLKDDLKSVAKQNVADLLRTGDDKTSRWYLEKKCPDEFSTKAAVALENAVVTLSLEEKEKAYQELVDKFEKGEA